MPEIDETACWYTLLCNGPLPRRVTKRLVHSWAIEGARPLAELHEQTSQILANELALTLLQAEELIASRAQTIEARAELDKWASRGVGIVTRADAAYPAMLVERLPEEQLPYVLFYAGSLVLATEPGVAVLGAEAPSSEANGVVDALATSLARCGHCLIGGYARGVDRLAMQGALAHGGSAALFLPLGFEGFESARVSLDLPLSEERLLVMSPYAPADPYDERRAEARMPLVGAMSGALALVEPQAESKGWNWAAHFAVAGGVLLIWSGSDAEIARHWVEQGAQPFDEASVAADQLAQLFGPMVPGSAETAEVGVLDESDLEPFGSANEALDALGRGGAVPEVLARRLRDIRRGE